MNCEVICFNSFCIVLLTESSSPIAPQQPAPLWG